MSSPTPDRFFLTGCASGIGLHLTQQLLDRGHRVTATDIDLDALRVHAESWPVDRVRVERLDVRDAEAWGAAVEAAEDAWGGIDVMLNVAGYIQPGRGHEIATEEVDRHFDINVKGVVYGTRTASQGMAQRGSGHIINIASLASLAPIPGIALYSASKYAVRAFSLAVAQELRLHDVAVTVVCPDAVETPMLDRQVPYEEAALTFTAPRFLTVEDVSRVILGRVLKRRPLMVTIPRWRGWLARLGDLSPGTARLLATLMARQGLNKQKAYREASR